MVDLKMGLASSEDGSVRQKLRVGGEGRLSGTKEKWSEQYTYLTATRTLGW